MADALEQGPCVVMGVPSMPPAGAYLVAQTAATLLAADRIARQLNDMRAYALDYRAMMTYEEAVEEARTLVSEATTQMRGEEVS